MEQSYEDLKNELDNLKKIVFRIMDYNFPDINANVSHYEFISDEVVRRQLELDFLKMLQTPASNFGAYCQYSFFQIENLLNYYYTLKFTGKLEPEITSFFAYDKTKYSRISKVPYSNKWTKYSQEFLQEGYVGEVKKKTINYDIQKIAYVRNSTIHKNTLETNAWEDETFEKYINLPNGKYTNDDEKEIYFAGLNITFKRNENFSLVKKRTLDFLKSIEPEIKKYQETE